MPSKLLFFVALFSIFSCVESQQKALQEPIHFSSQLRKNPASIWSPQIPERTKKALEAYNTRVLVKPGLYYGDSVRHYSLDKKCLQEIEAHYQSLHCKREEDLVKNPNTHLPVKTEDGQPVLLLVYICPDGGNIKIKPSGDPTSRMRPQPHSSKSLRYPHTSKFENYDDEIIKIDNQGYPVPKQIKDLNLDFVKENKDFIEEWANVAHTDLNPHCGSH